MLATGLLHFKETLAAACREVLAAHGTSLESDEALLRGEGAGAAGLSGRVRQAVECRLERKRLIAAAAEVLERYWEEALA